MIVTRYMFCKLDKKAREREKIKKNIVNHAENMNKKKGKQQA